jgi:hypothetical protein
MLTKRAPQLRVMVMLIAAANALTVQVVAKLKLPGDDNVCGWKS